EPAKCNSDKDCLQGQAKCIRRECHCVNNLAFGDGKTKCEAWKTCPYEKDPCTSSGQEVMKNSHCVRKPGKLTLSCRCDKGYFGRPVLPSCLKDDGADAHGRYPCLTDNNCPHYSKCIKNRCTCRYELIGNGETCKAPPPMSCTKDDDCHADKGKCVSGMCYCDGFYVGNGVQCRDAKRCPKDVKCGAHSTCMVDPLFPKTPTCKCDAGYRKNTNGKCVECVNNTHCNHVQETCYKGICKCKDELIKDEKTCKPAPLHGCRKDMDCDSRAKCNDGKCICQGNTTGNGKFCRETLACPQGFQCGIRGTCIVDPLIPKSDPKCRCETGYSYMKDGKCVECLSDKNCPKYSTCDRARGLCKCKDELIKQGKTCKPAPFHLCDEEHKCHEQAECFYGKCYCKGNLTGNGRFCRDSLQCPDDYQCGNNSICVVDPLFPKTPDCKCLKGFKMSFDGKCEEISECFKKGLLCPNKTTCTKTGNESYDCVCNKGFHMVHGLNYTCEENCNCTSHADCHHGKCQCTKGYEMNEEGHCVQLSAPRTSHQRQPGQWEVGTNLSPSSCVTSHVIILIMPLLCFKVFAL
ncbi:unnamed protein product, partial [Porites evermanni]